MFDNINLQESNTRLREENERLRNIILCGADCLDETMIKTKTLKVVDGQITIIPRHMRELQDLAQAFEDMLLTYADTCICCGKPVDHQGELCHDCPAANECEYDREYTLAVCPGCLCGEGFER